jgi:hypothetical protein
MMVVTCSPRWAEAFLWWAEVSCGLEELFLCSGAPRLDAGRRGQTGHYGICSRLTTPAASATCWQTEGDARRPIDSRLLSLCSKTQVVLRAPETSGKSWRTFPQFGKGFSPTLTHPNPRPIFTRDTSTSGRYLTLDETTKTSGSCLIVLGGSSPWLTLQCKRRR